MVNINTLVTFSRGKKKKQRGIEEMRARAPLVRTKVGERKPNRGQAPGPPPRIQDGHGPLPSSCSKAVACDAEKS